MDDLLFITYTNNPHPRSHDSKTRRAVRKRVWNAWRNEEPKRRLGTPSTQSLGQSQTRFRVPLPIKSEAMYKPQLLQSPSPWQAIVESSGDHAWTLLDYYFHRFRQNSTAINVEGDWISFTFSDDACRHAQLALVAQNAEYDLSTAVGNTIALSHVDQATKVIRERLHNTTEKPTCSLIGAVALLLIIDSIQDDQQRAMVHFRGLNSMLAVHGGLDAFSEMKTLHRVISWAQRCYWLSWHSETPLQAISKLDITGSDFAAEGHEPRIKLNPSLHKLHRFRDILCEDLIAILSALQHIATFPPPDARSRLDRLHISEAIYDVEQETILLYNKTFSRNNGVPIERPLSVTLLMAAAVRIYIFVVLRQMHTKSRVVQRYAKSLMADLQHVEDVWQNLDYLSNSAIELVTWMVALLLLTIHDDNSYSKLVVFFDILLIKSNITSADELEHALRQVAWMDDVLHEGVVNLWKEIKILRN